MSADFGLEKFFGEVFGGKFLRGGGCGEEVEVKNVGVYLGDYPGGTILQVEMSVGGV